MSISNPLESIHGVIVFSSKDWSLSADDAWIYGVVVGWDEPSLVELQKKHRWQDGEVFRLKELHEKYKKMWGDGLV